MTFRLFFLSLLAALLTIFTHYAASHDACRVAFLGDSNLWIGGDDCSNPKGWNKHFADLFPGRCRSFARSGATWTHTAATVADTLENIGILGDRNVILNQVLRLRGAVEQDSCLTPGIVIIAAGTNDGWFHTKRPGLFSDTLSLPAGRLRNLPPGEVRSLRDAIRLNLAELRSFLPDARIILLTPMQSTTVAPDMLNRISGIIERTAEDAGVEALRLDTLSPIRADEERRRHRLTSDGTHTSPEGARLTGIAVFSALFPEN